MRKKWSLQLNYKNILLLKLFISSTSRRCLFQTSWLDILLVMFRSSSIYHYFRSNDRLSFVESFKSTLIYDTTLYPLSYHNLLELFTSARVCNFGMWHFSWFNRSVHHLWLPHEIVITKGVDNMSMSICHTDCSDEQSWLVRSKDASRQQVDQELKCTENFWSIVPGNIVEFASYFQPFSQKYLYDRKLMNEIF